MENTGGPPGAVKPASSFQPSFLAKILSQTTAPRTLLAASTLGLATLMGAPLAVSAAVAAAALGAQHVVTKMLSGGDTLRSAVFVAAEHLTGPTVQGGLPHLIIPPLLKALKTMNSPDAIIARNCLEGLLNFETHFDYLGISNQALVSDLQKKIHLLKPGQKMAFPLSNVSPTLGGHVIMGSIERKMNGQFLVRYHNGGDCNSGLEYHHAKTDKETGQKCYQTTLEIDEIDEKNLPTFIKTVTSLHSFRLGHDTNKVYRAISLLNGKILPPSEDERYWSRAQYGSSCSGYAVKCLLNSLLTPENSQLFELRLLKQMTKDLKQGIQKGYFWDATTEHHLVYEELRGKLTRLGGSDPGPIENIKISYLAKAASKTQQSFWKIRVPHNPLLKFRSNLFPSISNPRYSPNLNPLLYKFFSNFEIFKDLNTDFINSKVRMIRTIDRYEYERKERKINPETHQALSEIMQKIPDKKQEEIKPILEKSVIPSLDHAKIILKKHYLSIDRSQFSREELLLLDKNENLIKILNDGPFSSVRNRFLFYELALTHFYLMVFPKLKYKIKDSGALQLSKAVECLKQKQLPQARELLINMYQAISSAPHLSPEQISDYIYVLIQSIHSDNPEKTKTIEEIELHAALALILRKLKTNNHNSSNVIAPEIIPNNINLYCFFRIDREFPMSPWKQDILNAGFYNSTKERDEYPPKDLQTLFLEKQ